MQVTRPTNLTPQQLVRPNGAPSPSPQGTPPEQPQDGYKPTVGGEALRTGIAWGNAAGTVGGGAVGLATVTGALYAGVLGGAIVGTLTGAGFGPVLSAVTSHGAMDFAARTFATAGFAAKAGMVIGGVSGAAGAWQVGSGIGNAVGKAAGFVPGAVIGAGKGMWAKAESAAGAGGGTAPAAPKPEKENLLKTSFTDLNNMSGGMKLYSSVLGGVGMLSGGVGGFTLGASVASAGSLVNGLLAHNVSLSTISGTAVVGGIVGGALFATIGGLGGFTAAKASKKLWDNTGAKLLGMAHKGDETQEAKKKRLDERAGELDVRKNTLEAQAKADRAQYGADTNRLNEREAGVVAQENDVNGRLADINGKIEAGGQSLYNDKASKPDAQTGESLKAWDGRLNKFDTTLKQFAAGLKDREAGLDATITRDSDARFAADRRPLEQKYDGLQGQLNGKEQGLNDKKRDIDNRIQTGFQSGVSAQRPGLEQDLRYAQDDKNRAQSVAYDAQREKSNASTQLSAAQSQLQTASNEANANGQRVNNLSSAIRDLDGQKNSLLAEHAQADATTQSLQSQISGFHK